jgi:hypothetical protein
MKAGGSSRLVIAENAGNFSSSEDGMRDFESQVKVLPAFFALDEEIGCIIDSRPSGSSLK